MCPFGLSRGRPWGHIELTAFSNTTRKCGLEQLNSSSLYPFVMIKGQGRELEFLFFFLFWKLTIYQVNEIMQVEVTGGVEVVLSLGCCYSEWQPEDQKYPKPLATTATMPPVVSEEEIMAKRSKIAPHHSLGIWPQIPVWRALASSWARPPIWSSHLPWVERPM